MPIWCVSFARDRDMQRSSLTLSSPTSQALSQSCCQSPPSSLHHLRLRPDPIPCLPLRFLSTQRPPFRSTQPKLSQPKLFQSRSLLLSLRPLQTPQLLRLFRLPIPPFRTPRPLSTMASRTRRPQNRAPRSRHRNLSSGGWITERASSPAPRYYSKSRRRQSTISRLADR
jgi:hypothetical protein